MDRVEIDAYATWTTRHQYLKPFQILTEARKDAGGDGHNWNLDLFSRSSMSV